MNDILMKFVGVAPYINQLTSSDFSVSVCDLKECICYIPGNKIDHKIGKGTPHIRNSASYKAIVEKKKIVKRIDKEVFGFPYIAIAIPLCDASNDIVGSVCFSETVDKQDLLMNIADALYDGIQNMVSVSNVISEKTLELKYIGEELNNAVNNSIVKVDETDEILGFIRNISRKTNLLGLNAAIEAARIGEEGKGFCVVADEIRNFSKITQEYVKKVNYTLKHLKNSIQEIDKKKQSYKEISAYQIKAVEAIGEFTKNINDMAEELSKQAKLLNE